MKNNAKTQIRVRRYRREDKTALEHLFEDFQDFLASVDNLGRLARRDALERAGFGKAYLRKTLRSISKNNGVFFVAEDKDKVIGFVVGLVVKPSKIARMWEKRPTTEGEITELYIDSSHRGGGLGRILMRKAETYLKSKGVRICEDWGLSAEHRGVQFL